MTYAGERVVLDADSHVMEMPDFLDGYVDPALKDRLRRDAFDGFQPLIDSAAKRRRAEPAAARSGGPVSATSTASAHTRSAAAATNARPYPEEKGWSAFGASDPAERSCLLDELGFEAQLVFSTFASVLYRGGDRDLLYEGIRAQNRALADFCSGDPRLLAVGFVTLSSAQRAVSMAAEALDAGCAAIMVPSTPAGGRAPTHPDLDPFWALLEERDVPFVLHVGGGGRLLDPAFHDNGTPVPDHLGGGENVRSKDALAIHHSPAVFLGALVLDGLFDRFPRLRGGCIEQGAGWVVSWLHQLDHVARSFRRTEEPLRRLADQPSAYVRRHLRFTPFPGEPVGWMMEQAGPELFMFSTDFPHPEGGRDPIAKFDAALEGAGEEDRRAFYASNMAWLLGGLGAGASRRSAPATEAPVAAPR
ncbi:MAG TPA: amidohydrolase family protein [Acidimicrobiales bacterium]|nr:amidohydrolase family protein [Acidimicrobiales bacterium]